MMREIKFQFLYKGLTFSSTNSGFNWHKKVYSLDDFMSNSLYELSDIHGSCELVAKRQFTGIKDVNGSGVFEGDILQFGIGFKMQRGVVIFHNGSFMFDINKPFFASKSIAYTSIKRKHSKAVIIGNIHQNPELLNKD